MLVKFKRTSPHARLPSAARVGDVGFDVYSSETVTIPAGRVSKVKTGLHIADWVPTLELHEHESNESIHTGNYGVSYVSGEHVSTGHLTVYCKMEGRSSLGSQGIFTIAGIIDPTYRGELQVTLANMTGEDYIVNMGDRVAQFVFYTCLTSPTMAFEETDTIIPTDRGDKGFGSTGR